MSIAVADPWSEKLEQALAGYDVSLVRSIAVRLLRARNQWPVDELRERLRDAINNAPVIDRRLKELSPACRKLLTLIGLSRRPDWKVGHMVEMLSALGHDEGLAPIQALFEEGLLHPVAKLSAGRLKGFEWWLNNGSIADLQLFAHPLVTKRARLESLSLPILPVHEPVRAEVREADGLEWPLRLAAAWQQVNESPLRRTIQQDFFKRDWQRLRSDPMLAAPFADHISELPDAGLLTVGWAHRLGLLRDQDGELRALPFGDAWHGSLNDLLADAWRTLLDVDAWNPARGWDAAIVVSNPFTTGYTLTLALLAAQPTNAWLKPADVADWFSSHHPNWPVSIDSSWADALLLGLFYQLKLVQVAPSADGKCLVRLSPVGRWLVSGDASPRIAEHFAQTLLVQPNFEVLVFRQGLTPDLIANLSSFARWKSLGAACQMELVADQVYRGLESGIDLEAIVRLLQQHGMRSIPENVLDALRTWANKRERIVVYSDVAIIEFATAADMEEATRRGLVDVRLTDRLGLVRNENGLDYRHFRLTGTRDYGDRPEKCLTVADDGLTLTVDAGRADLLLETELAQLTEPVDLTPERRSYRLTRAALLRAGDEGQSLTNVEEWLLQRAGERLSPAARLLAAPESSVQFRIEPCLILHAPTAEMADALAQLPETRSLIRERLGPTAISVSDADLPRLREAIEALKQRMDIKDNSVGRSEP
jgi:hypothetical protein